MKLFENDYEVNLSKKEASEVEISEISKNCPESTGISRKEKL